MAKYLQDGFMTPVVDETGVFITSMVVFLLALLLGAVYFRETKKMSFSEILLIGLPFMVSLIAVVSNNNLTSLIWGSELVYLATIWIIISRSQPNANFSVKIRPILVALVLGGIIYVAWDKKLQGQVLSATLVTSYFIVVRVFYWRLRQRLDQPVCGSR